MRVLITALALLLLPASARSQAPDRKFGGCNDALTLCAGPAASFSVVELNLSDDTSRAGLIPGIGYGVTFWPAEWYNAGASLFLEVVTGDGADVLAPAFVLSFAEYLRAGIGFRRTSDGGNSETDTLFLLGLGADFGPTPGLGLVAP